MKLVVRCGVVVVGFALLGGCGEGPSAKIERLRDLSRKGTPADRDRIAAMLDDADRDVRATTLVVMAEVDPERAYAMALRALDDRDGFVRAAAVRIVGTRLDEGTVARLTAMGTADHLWQVRGAALAALGEAPLEAVRPAFEQGLADSNPHVRRAALAAGKVRPGLLPTAAVGETLLKDEIWENRVAAATILGASADPEAFAPLDEASLDQNEFVRAAAVRERQALLRGGTLRPAPPPSPSPAPETTKRPPGV